MSTGESGLVAAGDFGLSELVELAGDDFGGGEILALSGSGELSQEEVSLFGNSTGSATPVMDSDNDPFGVADIATSEELALLKTIRATSAMGAEPVKDVAGRTVVTLTGVPGFKGSMSRFWFAG